MKPASFPSRGRGWDLPGGGEKPRAAPQGRFLEHRVLAKVCTSRGRRQGWAASVAGRRHPAGQGIELQPWGSAGKKPTLLSRSGRDKKKKKRDPYQRLSFALLRCSLLCSAALPRPPRPPDAVPRGSWQPGLLWGHRVALCLRGETKKMGQGQLHSPALPCAPGRGLLGQILP